MTKDEALRLALAALDSVLANHKGAPVLPWIEARDAIKAALEVPEEKYIYGTPLLDAVTKEKNHASECQVSHNHFWIEDLWKHQEENS
jgi:hypothetical protein